MTERDRLRALAARLREIADRIVGNDTQEGRDILDAADLIDPPDPTGPMIAEQQLAAIRLWAVIAMERYAKLQGNAIYASERHSYRGSVVVLNDLLETMDYCAGRAPASTGNSKSPEPRSTRGRHANDHHRARELGAGGRDDGPARS